MVFILPERQGLNQFSSGLGALLGQRRQQAAKQREMEGLLRLLGGEEDQAAAEETDTSTSPRVAGEVTSSKGADNWDAKIDKATRAYAAVSGSVGPNHPLAILAKAKVEDLQHKRDKAEKEGVPTQSGESFIESQLGLDAASLYRSGDKETRDILNRRAEDAYKTNLGEVTEEGKKYRAQVEGYEDTLQSLDEAERLSRQGDIGGFTNWVAGKIGLKDFLNAPVQQLNTTIKNLFKPLKTIFGARPSNIDVLIFQSMLPSINSSKDARLAVIDMLRYEAQIGQAQAQSWDQASQELKGRSISEIKKRQKELLEPQAKQIRSDFYRRNASNPAMREAMLKSISDEYGVSTKSLLKGPSGSKYVVLSPYVQENKKSAKYFNELSTDQLKWFSENGYVIYPTGK